MVCQNLNSLILTGLFCLACSCLCSISFLVKSQDILKTLRCSLLQKSNDHYVSLFRFLPIFDMLIKWRCASSEKMRETSWIEHWVRYCSRDWGSISHRAVSYLVCPWYYLLRKTGNVFSSQFYRWGNLGIGRLNCSVIGGECQSQN